MLVVPFLSLWLVLCGTDGSACASLKTRTGETQALNSSAIPARTIALSVLPEYTIRHEAPEVRIQFNVSDGAGRTINHLSQSDIQILDNQRTVPYIRDFSRSEDLPLQLAMLLDVSDSVHKSVALERQAVQFAIGHLLRSESDRFLLATFSRETSLLQGFTGDRRALLQTASNIGQQGHATYLFDSLYHLCLEQFSPDPPSDAAQRILLVISDGNDTGSVHSLGEATSVAQRRGIQIYALAFHSSRITSAGDQVLKHLAEATGGQFVIANSDRDVPALCSTMEQQMRTQFVVSFQPAELAPGFHTVRIELLRNSKGKVHTRSGYFVGTL
jgi:VWFA-related protein